MGIIQAITNPVFNPLLKLGPLWAVIVVSFIVSLLVTLIYKFVTDQKDMKRLKGELKEYQKRMKESRSNPEEVMRLQKEAMGLNMTYMKQSFKPTIITFLPIILIFGWLNAHLAFVPIMPGDTFSLGVLFQDDVKGNALIVVPEGMEVVGESVKEVNSGVDFDVKGVKAGEYFIDIEFDGQIYTKDLVVTTQQTYAEQIQTYDGPIKSITIEYEKLKPLGELKIFGWQPGWLGLYIIFSLIFSMVLRKVLKIH